MLRKLGGIGLFFLRILAGVGPALRRPRLIVHQIYNAGARSLIIIMLSGLFVGMVLGLQGYDLLQRIGSEDVLGIGIALALLKQLGPVMAALLFAGRAGTALASEIGLMRATDQLTAMEMMAVDPVHRIVVPRFLGGFIALPLLVAICDAIGLYGAHLIAVQQMGIDAGSFWSQTQSAVEIDDVLEGIYKGQVFGAACSLIAVYEGFHAAPTAEGVSLATTRTVVNSSVLILLLNYLLTAFYL
jgi:phospholipid/cholesterol/gamma-HCH transport system permease protein